MMLWQSRCSKRDNLLTSACRCKVLVCKKALRTPILTYSSWKQRNKERTRMYSRKWLQCWRRTRNLGHMEITKKKSSHSSTKWWTPCCQKRLSNLTRNFWSMITVSIWTTKRNLSSANTSSTGSSRQARKSTNVVTRETRCTSFSKGQSRWRTKPSRRVRTNQLTS